MKPSAESGYQAIIVGGGPAGLAAGIVFARNGIRTLLLERRSLPYAKVCGEGLMPSGLAALARLGLPIAPQPAGDSSNAQAHTYTAENLSDANSRPLRGIKYVDLHTGRCAAAEFAEGPGCGMPRRVLSARLLNLAQSFAPTLTIQADALCDTLRRDADGIWTVRLGSRELRTPLLIGADGINSFVRRAAALDRDHSKRDVRRWGARWHFPVAPWTDDFVEVQYSPAGVECYLTPVGDAEIGVAFLWDRARFRPGTDGLLDSLLDLFPEVRARIGETQALPDGGAIGPLLRRVRAVTGRGVLLLGDAAGYLDAATGEGLSLAFEEALALEDTVVPALRSGKNKLASGALRSYRRRYRSITRNYYRTTPLVLWLGRRASLMRRVVAGLGASPEFFQQMLSINRGTRSIFAIGPVAFMRFLWGALRSARVRPPTVFDARASAPVDRR